MSSAVSAGQTTRLVGIYNANGGVVGELTYVLGKLKGTAHCALCDISHGKSFRAKKEWVNGVSELPLPLETVHLNEMDDATRVVADGRSPVVVYLDGCNDRVLITEDELESCSGTPTDFFELLKRKIAEL